MCEENTARAFWVREPGAGELREDALPAPRGGEVRVRALYSGISRGTETLVFQGRVPESQYAAMRCPFQEGGFPGPVKYGYMNVGIVEAAGPGSGGPGDGPDASALVGRTVFCLHPHQERYVVPASWVTPVPGAVPPGRAILAANVETALNGVWDGAPSVGDRVAVVGGGVVGLLVAHLVRKIPATQVVVVDPEPRRADVAAALGVAWVASTAEALEAQGAGTFGETPSPPATRRDAGRFDLVFHASGNPAGAADALALLGDEGTMVELSWFGDRGVTLPLGEDFHARRLTLKSSQVGRIPPQRAPRWSHARRMATVMELLADPALDALVTGESPFEALPAVMARLAGKTPAPEPEALHDPGLPDPDGTLCHRIRYSAPASG